MSRSTQHELQPGTDHDGLSRRLAVLACKTALRSQLQTAMRADFDNTADIEAQPSYRFWSAANRASQDRMWQILAAQVDADYDRIDAAATDATRDASGSVSADATGPAPAYQARAAVHGQPGGYMLDRGTNDLAAGILYEAGGNIYAMGQGNGKRDSKGERLIAHIREHHPDLAPQRILEMGCSAGGQTTDYPPAFPDAEVHAIDLSPGMLRYAHARAELLGSRVHFHRQDAGATSFPDAHFDLIVSHNLFHEVAAEHMPAIAAECRRLLAPGGICIHQDVPIQTRQLDDFMRFVSEWQKDHNDEPFWKDFADADLPAMMIEAGFDPDNVSEAYLQAIDGPIPWYVVTATA